MEAVILKGIVVVRDDREFTVYPGRLVRFEPTEPTFALVSRGPWVERVMVGVEIPAKGCLPPPETQPEHFPFHDHGRQSTAPQKTTVSTI